MRTYAITVMATAMLAWSAGCASVETTAADKQMEKKIDKLLAKMTLEEKVGQMTQVTLEVVGGESSEDGWLKLDEKKLQDAIIAHQVGSILNCGGQARSVDNWLQIITQMQAMATKQTRLGIPIIYGIDAIHGANYTLGATIFPQHIAMAATGNVELVRIESEITALEVRASGMPWNFSPVLGLGRNPMWPRQWETFGEDAYISSVMAAAYVEGQQGSDISQPTKVAACMKHYLGYSVPLSGKDRTPAYIPERQLRQLFLKPFAAAAKVGVATVMVNSSEINGIPVHSDRFLLIDVLRGELGFEGFVVSDWADINNLYTREMVARYQRQAVKMAVMAGVDMSMVPYDYSFYEHLVDLVKTGEVPMSRIDEAVADILRVKFQLGLFEKPYPDKQLKEQFATDASRQANLQAAREAMTLLKNESGLLPLGKDKKVLVTGPCSDKLSILNGGWTITWQGDNEALYPQEKSTILEAIQDKVGASNVEYIEAVKFDKELDISRAVSAASRVDVIVACLGEPTYCETPGNIDDLMLSAPQIRLVQELAKTDKPIVMVFTQGRPRVIRTIVDNAGAILMAYLPGMEGGQAIADVLFGDANPSGKLPFTYPKYSGWHVCYDHKKSENAAPNKFDPQWEFGHGLSYTTFKYGDLRIDKNNISADDTLIVTVNVTNTGQREAAEIVQLFLSDIVATVTPPVKSLKRFTKIFLKPGEKQTVKFELSWDDFAFIGRQNKPVVEPGEFKISLGGLTKAFEIQ